MTGRGTLPGDLGVPGTGTTGRAAPGMPPEIFRPQFNSGFSMFLSSFPDFPFSAMLSLLESNGLAKTLAEPTLVTLSGQQARFLAGGELPIPLGGSFGQVQVEWKKFGIILDFTPTVIAADTIHLDMKAEVSDIDSSLAITVGGTTIPGLTSRQSETTVRLGDGQSFAIAGLRDALGASTGPPRLTRPSSTPRRPSARRTGPGGLRPGPSARPGAGARIPRRAGSGSASGATAACAPPRSGSRQSPPGRGTSFPPREAQACGGFTSGETRT